MNSVFNYFSIKCKNCGSERVEIEVNEIEDDWYSCKQETRIVCLNCYNDYKLEN